MFFVHFYDFFVYFSVWRGSEWVLGAPLEALQGGQAGVGVQKKLEKIPIKPTVGYSDLYSPRCISAYRGGRTISRNENFFPPYLQIFYEIFVIITGFYVKSWEENICLKKNHSTDFEKSFARVLAEHR